MKLFSILYFTFGLIIYQCSCFNINTDNPIIYLDQAKYFGIENSTKSSYFGYSVILYPGHNHNDSWVQIGAPRANIPNGHYKNPGIVFRCKIGETCEPLVVDREYGLGKIVANDRKFHYNNKMDDAWIGGAMDINLSTNRSVVCGARWMNIFQISNSKEDYRMYGACYWSRLNSTQFHKKLPLLGNNDTQRFITAKSLTIIYNYGQGQAGFSVHIPTTGEEMLIGAPGVFNWKGTSILYTDKPDDTSPLEATASVFQSPTDNKKDLTDSEIFNDVNIMNSAKSQSNHGFSLFGYSVSSGFFFNKILYYVSSAPRDHNYRGEVLIYRFDKKKEMGPLVKDSRRGTQFGEYFGGCVAVGDINNDGFDDLFVGAPFRKTLKFNEGRIYLFLGSKKGFLQEPSTGEFVDGKEPNAQFGTAITYLGNMKNKLSNTRSPRFVAVAAPYEETSGVVYIFKGRVNGMDTVPIQRIVGSTIYSNLRGFGISISKPADIDGNGYEDIAIGAHESNHVVLLRSSPLVQLHTYFQHFPDTIPIDFTSFNATVCNRYIPKNIHRSFRIIRKILVDEDMNRAFLDPGTKPYAEDKSISKDGPFCQTIKIYRSKPTLNNYSPIVIRVTHSIEEEKHPGKRIVSDQFNGTDYFCKDCGVYDDLDSKKTVVAEIPIHLGCGTDNTCSSELEFESTFEGIGVSNNSFILGATNVISMVTVVKNLGERAYLLKVQVDLPQDLNFKQIPTSCEKINTGLICLVADPLDENKTEHLALKLDMNLINRKFEKKFLMINVTVSTTSQNQNESFKSVRLDLKTEADISITGKSGEQSYSYGNSTIKKVPFQQIYQIAKYGRSPVYEMKFKIRIPYAIKTKTGTVPFLSLYQPKESLTDIKYLKFESDIPYIQENIIGPTEGIEQENLISSIEKTTSSNTKMEDFRMEKKTHAISCNMTDVICGEVSGTAGTFEGQKSVVFTLRMILDFDVLADIIMKDSIPYITEGEVESLNPPHLIQSGKRPDKVEVSSLFINDGKKKKIALWIIVVSIASGLLLLLFLIVGLAKAGFFKRAKKEELKNLKAQADATSNDAIVTENENECVIEE